MASSARIDELRKKFDENPRRYFAPLANEYRKAGEVEQAITICREYLPQQPGHMSGHIVYGQALYEARQLEEARSVFETALSLDPENLIALRHLGDIALMMGDASAARSWYGRVLEADPRNEEIQGQLASLDLAAASAPTPTITPAVTPSSAPTVVMSAVKPPVTATSPTAEVNLDEILPATPEPSEPSAGDSTQPDLQPRADETPSASAVDALEGLEPTSATGADAPQSGGFGLDGLETTSLSQGDATPAPLQTLELDQPAAPDGPVEAAPLADLEPTVSADAEAASRDGEPTLPTLELETTAIETPPPSPPSLPSPVAAAAEALPDLDLDLAAIADTPSEPRAAPPAEPRTIPPAESIRTEPGAATTSDEAPLDLELSLPEVASPGDHAPPNVREPEPSAVAPVAALVDAIELEDFAPPAAPAGVVESTPDTPVESVATESAPLDSLAIDSAAVEGPAVGSAAPVDIDDGAHSTEAVEPDGDAVPTTVAGSGPFVTETMAELYLQQGHREEALRVYRALADQRPEDTHLAAKVARLAASLSRAQAAASVPAHLSIRDLLARIAQRRPGHRPASPADSMDPRTPAGPTPAVGAAPAMQAGEGGADESLQTPPAFERAEVQPPAESRSEPTVPPHNAPQFADDTLAAVLALRAPSEADERAARALGAAFASNGRAAATPLISGAPARPAAGELSLDSVFKGEAAAPSPGSFSFDQFFSKRVSAEQPAIPETGGPAGAQGGGAESPEEVARFTQWLEGLKGR